MSGFSFSGERRLGIWDVAGSFSRKRTDKERCFPGPLVTYFTLIVEEGTAHVWMPEDSARVHSLSSVWVLQTRLRSPGSETNIFYLQGHLAGPLPLCTFIYSRVCMDLSVYVQEHAGVCRGQKQSSDVLEL